MIDKPQNGQLLVPTAGDPIVRGVDTDYIPLFDPSRLQQMLAIAELMAQASLIPEHLKVRDLSDVSTRPAPNAPGWQHRKWAETQPVDLGGTIGNCLLIVNQAARWRMDPFALAMSTFRTPNGQIGYEGKVVAAALDAILGIGLTYKLTGEEGSLDYGVEVSGPDKNGNVVTVKGTVKQWATYDRAQDGDAPMKQNWKVQPTDQLIYRGTRQWTRRYRAGVILGVYTEDEMDDLRMATEIADAPRTVAGQASGIASRLQGNGGFSHGAVAAGLDQIEEHVDPQTGELLGTLRESVKATDTHAETAKPKRASRKAAENTNQTVATGNNPPGTATGAPAAVTAAPDAGDQTPAAPTAAETNAASQPAAALAAAAAGPITGGAAENSTGATQDAPAASSLEPATLREYSDILARATSAKGIHSYDSEFWSNGRERPNDVTGLQELRTIYSIHLKRVKKEITDDEAKRDLDEVIGG